MRRLPRFLLLLCCGGLLLSPAANAAQTPKAKTLYRDGPSGRFLLDGAWYQRPDPNDQGVGLRYQRQASLAGWSRTTVPRAVNAGNFSTASYMGTVAWFRKDFKLPNSSPTDKWVLRFE